MSKTLKNTILFGILFATLVFVGIFCGCGNATENNTKIQKNFAKSVEAEDLSLIVGQTQELKPKVETGTEKVYDLGFEFLCDDQDVFEIVDNFVVAKNAGIAVLTIRAISGFDENFYENLFVETTISVVVLPRDDESQSFEDAFSLKTMRVHFEDVDFENLQEDALVDLEKEDEKHIIYYAKGEKQDKIEALNKNFCFYALIMFDNINLDWYNFTITCNSKVFSVQKISNWVYVICATNVGEGVATITETTQNVELSIIFKVKEIDATYVDCLDEDYIFLEIGQTKDLTPSKILPAYASPKMTLVADGDKGVVLISGLQITANQKGSCFVTLFVGNFSKTFVVCVTDNKTNLLVVPQTNFQAEVGQMVEIRFAVSDDVPENAQIALDGQTNGLSVDFVMNCILVQSSQKGNFEFEIVFRTASKQILVRSEKISVSFT